MTTLLKRDERELAVDHSADRLSYLVLAFGVLGVAAWRSLAGDPTWDLLGLVVLSGLFGLTYRYRMGVVTRSWATVAAIAAVAAAVLALLMATGLGR